MLIYQKNIAFENIISFCLANAWTTNKHLTDMQYIS